MSDPKKSGKWALDTAYWLNWVGRWQEADNLLMRIIRHAVPNEEEENAEAPAEPQSQPEIQTGQQ